MRPVTDATERIRLRRSRDRRRTALTVVVSLLVVLAVGAATWLVGFSSVLAVRQVTVTGTRTLSPDEVTRAAAVEVGLPMARVDAAAVEARVAALAPVKTVTLQRQWPSTIILAVTERTPVFAVKQNHGTGYLLVDETGKAFREVASPPTGLLRVTAADAALLGDVAAVVAELPPQLRDQVEQIDIVTRDGITLKLTSARTVVWGSAERSRFKATVLLALLQQKGTTYDVSAPDFPAVR